MGAPVVKVEVGAAVITVGAEVVATEVDAPELLESGMALDASAEAPPACAAFTLATTARGTKAQVSNTAATTKSFFLVKKLELDG